MAYGFVEVLEILEVLESKILSHWPSAISAANGGMKASPPSRGVARGVPLILLT